MEDISYSDLTIEKLPEGDFIVAWYNSIHQWKDKPQEYLINIILKNIETNEPVLIERNTKEIPAIVLGQFVKNKKFDSSKIGQHFICKIHLGQIPNQDFSQKLSTDISASHDFFNFSQDGITLSSGKTYNLKKYNHNQKLLIYRDIESNKNIIFPSYEIARYFYFRSPSMIKQVMSSNLGQLRNAVKGFFKNLVIDLSTGEGEITLNNNAANIDAPEIFRFAYDSYACKMFHLVKEELVRHNEQLKRLYEKNNWKKDHNWGDLNVFFPFADTDVEFKVRGLKLDNGDIFVLEILTEDSPYPFQDLAVYKEHKKTLRPILQGSIRKRLQKNIEKTVTNQIPSTVNGRVEIIGELAEESRQGLIDKTIRYKNVPLDEDAEVAMLSEHSKEKANLDSENYRSFGNEDTARMDIHPKKENDQENEEKLEDRDAPTLDDFKMMLQLLYEEEIDFSYVVSDEHLLPTRPKGDRRLWKMAYLKDGTTRRRYVFADIQYRQENFTAIEIERDDKLPSKSTLLLKRSDGAKVHEGEIDKIVKNFVKYHRRWLYTGDGDDFSEYSNVELKHPEESNEKSLKEWAIRFFRDLDKLSRL